jgi:hypothetical protein
MPGTWPNSAPTAPKGLFTAETAENAEEKYQNQKKGGSCKSRSLRHSGESRNPESIENPGFRVALRLPGMTIFSCFQEFCKNLKEEGKFFLDFLFNILFSLRSLRSLR